MALNFMGYTEEDMEDADWEQPEEEEDEDYEEEEDAYADRRKRHSQLSFSSSEDMFSTSDDDDDDDSHAWMDDLMWSDEEDNETQAEVVAHIRSAKSAMQNALKKVKGKGSILAKLKKHAPDGHRSGFLGALYIAKE